MPLLINVLAYIITHLFELVLVSPLSDTFPSFLF